MTIEFGSLKGDLLTMHYQAFNGVQTEMRTLEIDDLETLADLRSRLAKLTGFSEFMVICGGQIIDLTSSPSETVRESGIGGKGALLIKKIAGSQQEDRSEKDNISAAEREIVKHFNKLYELMGSEDELSISVCQ